MSNNPIIPIYTTKGDAEAFLQYPYLFNRSGEWIGFVTPKREVYSVLGEYVGTLTND
ncbi:MAG: 4-fold beta flower protein, partial [Anaerolineales bacterium]